VKETLLGHYMRTLAHLRPSQVFWRAWYMLERSLPARMAAAAYARRPPELSPAPPATVPAPPHSPWGETELNEIAQGLFRFLHEQRSLGRHTLNWHLGPIRRGRLWVANLHYHEWAYRLAEASLSGERFAPQAFELFHKYVGDWIAQCPATARGARHLAWNPYVIATRLGWWARALWLLRKTHQQIEPALEQAMLRSAFQQSKYLAQHIEWDTCGNHLLRNALGLAWASRLIERPEASRWRARAERIASREMPRQFLSDGGHYERTAMYHATVLHDLIMLGALLPELPCNDLLRSIVQRGLEWLDWMRHPDGDICLFNDAALGLASSTAYLCKAAATIGCAVTETSPTGLRWFRDTGIVAWQGRPWTIFFDAGEVGPPEQPGHAHADTLSIEASLNGHRLFVDTGVLHYDPTAERDYERATAAHNTVCVDGENSSEVWGLFRVGRMAHVVRCRAEQARGGFAAEAEHNGYRFLFGAPRHARRLELQADHTLTITDRITGRGEHTIEGGLLLGSGWEARATTQGWLVQGPGGQIRIRVAGAPAPELELQPRPYYPTFGIQRAATRLIWRVRAALPVEFAVTVTI
jgi:uncharacterized heparinase superfamily protein